MTEIFTKRDDSNEILQSSTLRSTTWVNSDRKRLHNRYEIQYTDLKQVFGTCFVVV